MLASWLVEDLNAAKQRTRPTRPTTPAEVCIPCMQCMHTVSSTRSLTPSFSLCGHCLCSDRFGGVCGRRLKALWRDVGVCRARPSMLASQFAGDDSPQHGGPVGMARQDYRMTAHPVAELLRIASRPLRLLSGKSGAVARRSAWFPESVAGLAGSRVCHGSFEPAQAAAVFFEISPLATLARKFNDLYRKRPCCAAPLRFSGQYGLTCQVYRAVRNVRRVRARRARKGAAVGGEMRGNGSP